MSAKRTALYDTHINLGAKIIEFAGYDMPVRYSSDIEEHMKIREGVGVFDVSHMGEFWVEGDRAEDLLQFATSNDVTSLYDGRVQYSCLPNDEGGIVDDLLVYRNNKNSFMLVVNASNIEKDWARITHLNKNFGAKLTNRSDDYSLFAVQGPKAVELLQKLCKPNLSEIAYYHFIIDEFAGVPDVIISSTGYTGSGGFEIYVKNENALAVWNKIFEAGQEFNVAPIGLGARDTLRLEMGFCLYGNDITDETNPLEAGLGWITKLDTGFVASDLIKEQKEKGLKRKLVGFKMLDRGIPRHGYEVQLNGEKIGEVTSGSQSPILKNGIGMAYVPIPFNKPGQLLDIVVRNRLLKAEIVKFPFI
jgi:aminomethyltransferase